MLVFENMLIKEVPDNFYCCSMCGVHKEVTSFNNDNSNTRTRTNCKECYELSLEDFEKMKKERKSFEQSREYKDKYREFQYIKMIMNNSVSKEEYIQILLEQIEKIKTELPDNALVTEYTCDDYDGVQLYKPFISIPRQNKHAEFGYDLKNKIDDKEIYYIS